MTFNEVFKSTTLYDGMNDSLEYETYRQAYKLWSFAQKVVIEHINNNTYYDYNIGQQCFNVGVSIDDIEEML